MVKTLNYIKKDYPSDIDEFCLESYKEIYPDFEFKAWKPGSSPIAILYKEGGLFIGPGILARKRLEEEVFDKPFFCFNNAFESTGINLGLCYSEKENPIFAKMIEDGILNTLYKEGLDDSNKIGFGEKDLDLGSIKLLNRFTFGFDTAYYELYDSPFLDTNLRFEPVYDCHLQYLIADKETDSNRLGFAAERFSKIKSEEKRFFLLVNNGADDDLISRIGTLLLYSSGIPTRLFEIINLGGTDKVMGVLAEYIGRKFNNLKSCKRI